MSSHPEQTTMATHICVRQEAREAFFEWQRKLHEKILTYAGFASLEIISPSENAPSDWIIIQSFYDRSSLSAWRQSHDRQNLLDQLKPFLKQDNPLIKEVDLNPDIQKGQVVEVFITQVSADQVEAYREWIGKIHEAETKFTGFEKVYVQAPKNEKNGSWITLLQFDSPENLDRWLASPERQKILAEAKLIIKSLESHRVTSSFSGWFQEYSQLSSIPPVWKQTMLVLLVLFPVVMLELRFLNPLMEGLNTSLKTFIGNAISVTLVSWPLMPIAIYFLKWWLNPPSIDRFRCDLKGFFVVVLLFLTEIAILWYLI